MLVDDVRSAVGALPDVSEVRVEIVWSPPWHKGRISERGRRVMAVYGVVC
jgi:metal-sulfur cluster biosynthetic enzyme